VKENIDVEGFLSTTDSYAIGHTIEYVDSTPSTMSMAKKYIDHASAHASTRSGTVFVAEEQTHGRGRKSRVWNTPPGKALLFSTILQQPYLPQNPAFLAMVAGLAAAQAIENFINAPADHVSLKWPNDLLLQLNHSSELKPTGSTLEMGKVGGILIESVFQNNMVQYAIVGIGINVNQTLSELPSPPFGAPKPTSIRLYLEKVMDRTALLTLLCRELSKILTEYSHIASQSVSQDKQTEVIYYTWRNRLDTLNKQVAIYDHAHMPATGNKHKACGESLKPKPIILGKAVDVTIDGDLIIEDAEGCRQKFSAGDVSVRAPHA